MRPIRVKQLHYDLTPTAGLALVRHHLKTLAPVLAQVDAALPVRTGVDTSDIVRSDHWQLLVNPALLGTGLECATPDHGPVQRGPPGG